MRGRLEQILAGRGDLVQFADWDQDQTAVQEQYWRSDPSTVQRELTAAFEEAASVFRSPRA